jgi:hypothetical protein
MELSQVLQALENAHAAGDKEAARELAQLAQQMMAGGGMPQQPEPQPESGFLPALKAGASGVKSAGAALLGRTGVMDEDRAKQIMSEEEAYQQRTFKPTQTWGEAPLTKGLELLGGSLPYMAAPVALGVAGAAAPIAGAGTAAAGLASLAQFTGTNLQRQMETGKELGETNLGGAAAAAVPQAALDMIGFKMMPGIRQIFAAAGKEVSEKAAVEIAKQGTKEILKDYGVGALKTAGAEGLTEAGQQFFERLQAGLSIGDEAARSEYFDNFIGGAVLGGTIAPAGRYIERGQTANKQSEARREEERLRAAETAKQVEADALKAEEFKKTPEYLDNIKQSYEELQGKLEQLDKAAKQKVDKLDLAGQERVREARKALNELKKDPKTAELIAQYNAALPRLGERAKLGEEKALRDVATEEVFGEKAQAKQQGAASDVAQAQDIFGQIQALDEQMKGMQPAAQQPLMNRRNVLEDSLKQFVPSRDEFETAKQKLDGLMEQAYTGLTTAKTTGELQRYDADVEKYKVALGNLQKFEPMLPKVEAAPKQVSANDIRAKLQKEQSNGEGADIEKIRRLTRQLADAERQGELQFEGFAVESPLADEIAAGAKAAKERRELVEKETEALTRIGNKELSPFELALKRERLEEARALLRKSRGASKSEVSDLIRLNEQDWSRLKEDPENVMYGQDREALAESLKKKINALEAKMEGQQDAGPSLLSRELDALNQSLAEVKRKIELGRKYVKAGPDADTTLTRASDERIADLIDRLLPLATSKEKSPLADEQASLFDVEANKELAAKAFEAAPTEKKAAEPTRVQTTPIEQAQRLMDEARDARAQIKTLNEQIQKAGRPRAPEKVAALDELKYARDAAQKTLLRAQQEYDRLTEMNTPAYKAEETKQEDLFGGLEEARGEANAVKAELGTAYDRFAEIRADLDRRGQLGRTPELQALAEKYSKETFGLKEVSAQIEKLEKEYARLTGKVSERYGAFVEQREAARAADGSSTLADMKAQLADLKEKLPYFKKVGDERSIKAVDKAVTSLEYDIAEMEEKGEKAVRSRTTTLPGFERRAGVRAPAEAALMAARTKMVNLETLGEDLRIALADQGGDPTRYLREVAAKKQEELDIHKVQTDDTGGMPVERVKVLKTKYPETKQATPRDEAYYAALEQQIKYLNNVMKGRSTKVLTAALEKNAVDQEKARAELETLESRKRAYEQQEAVRTGAMPGTAEAQKLIDGGGYRTAFGDVRKGPKKLASWGITKLEKQDKPAVAKQSTAMVRSVAQLQQVQKNIAPELEESTANKGKLASTIKAMTDHYDALKAALAQVYPEKTAKEVDAELEKLTASLAQRFPDAKPEDMAATYRQVKKSTMDWQANFNKLIGRLNTATFNKSQELSFAETEAENLFSKYEAAKAKYDKLYKSPMNATLPARLSNAEFAEKQAFDAYSAHQADEVGRLQREYMEARIAQLNLVRLYGQDLQRATASSADNLAKLAPQFAEAAANEKAISKKYDELTTKLEQQKAAENLAKREADSVLSEERMQELDEASKRRTRIAEGLGLPGTRYTTDTSGKLASLARVNARRLLALANGELEKAKIAGDQVEIDRAYAKVKDLEEQLEQVQALGDRVVTPVGEGREDREVEVTQPKPVAGERLKRRKEGPVTRVGTMPPGQFLSGTEESRTPIGKTNTPTQAGAIRIRASDMDPATANAISLATMKQQLDAATGERKEALQEKFDLSTNGMTKAQISAMVKQGNDLIEEGGTLEVIAAREEARDALAAVKAAEKDLREAKTNAAKEIARDDLQMAEERLNRAEGKLENAKAMAEMQPNKTGKQQATQALEEAEQTPADKRSASMKAIDDAYNDLMETSYKTGYRTRAELTTVEAIRDGRLMDALDYLAQVGSTPLLREQAEKIRPFVMRTKVKINNDLVGNDGAAIPAAYDPATNTVYFRDNIAEEDIIHEVTHAATVQTMTMPEADLTPVQRGARREIMAMYKLAKDDPKLNNEDGSKAYGAKDELEFVSEVQSNADFRAKLDKKPWYKRLWSAMLRLIGYTPAESVSAKASRLIETLYAPSKNYVMPDKSGVLPSIFRAKKMPQSAIVGYEAGKAATLRENLFGLSGRVQYIDRLAAADAGIIEAESAGKLTSMEAFNAQYFMRMGEQVTQAAGQFITDGPVRIVSDKKSTGVEHRFESTAGANLLNVSKGIEEMATIGNMEPAEAERMLTSVIAGMRASALPNGWQRLNTSNPAAAKAEYDADVARMKADPALKAVVDRTINEYKQYNLGLLEFAAQCGYLSKDEVQRLSRTPYVPFYRVENGAVQLFVAGEKPITIGNMKDSPDLKQFMGDDKHIMPIMTSAVQNTFMLTRAAMRNKATMETSNALYKAGFVTKMGKGVGLANTDTVHYKIDGADHFAVIDSDTFGVPAKLIVQGMEGIKTTLPTIIQMMGIPANWLRKFITRSPAYVIRQLLREPVNAAITGGVDGVPIVNALKQMRDMRAGRSPAERALMRGLVVSSNVYTGGEQDMQKFLNDVSAGRGGFDKFMGKLDTVALQADAATRATIYEDSLKKGFTEAQAQFRAFEAQNFSRRGLSPSMQALSTMIPFFNAQIQGLDVLYRSLTGKMPFAERLEIQRKIVARGSMVFALSLAYAMMMQDDERYKKARPEERYTSIFMPLPGTKDMLKIPVPFETGVLFMGLPQMLVDMASDHTANKDALKGMGKVLLQSAPGVIPAGPKPFLEAYYNQTAFGPLESSREKNLEASQRFRADTTQVARLLGGLTGQVGVSPIMLEHFVKGYTGPLGIALLSTLNPVLREFNPIKEGEAASAPMNKTPFIGGLFQPAEGRFLIDRAYDRMEEIVQAQQTYKDLIARGQRAEAAEYAQKYGAMISAGSEAGAFRQQMGEYFTMERQIKANPKLTTAQKDRMLEKLKQQEDTYSEMLYKFSERTKPR